MKHITLHGWIVSRTATEFQLEAGTLARKVAIEVETNSIGPALYVWNGHELDVVLCPEGVL